MLQQRLDDAIEARVGSEYEAERIKLRADGDKQELERLRRAHAELQERMAKLAQAQDATASSAAADAQRLRNDLDALEQVRSDEPRCSFWLPLNCRYVASGTWWRCSNPRRRICGHATPTNA